MDDIVVAETALSNVSIEYFNNDEKLGFQVVDFAGATLTLIEHEALVEAAKNGAVLEDVSLLADGRTYDGLKLGIDRRAQVPGMISAYAVDDRTKAALWEEAYYRAKGTPRMPASDNKVPPLVPQRGHHTEAARIERLGFIRDQTGAALEKIAHTSLEADRLSGNLESFIGSIEIPIGAAGPLIINGEHAQGTFYAPIATTEGALVASISRGAWALSHSGGVTAQVFRQRMMRVPYFVVGDMHQAMFFATWITEHFAEIKAKTQEFSNHADLVELNPQIQGSRIHVHFVYETGDAAGQNMTTTCTWKTCLWILEKMEAFRHIDIQNFIIEANLSNDKKVTYQSFINGRGIHAQAEVFLPNRVIKRVLKVEPTQLFQGYKGLMQGGLQAGMVGFNVNVANLIAGIFTATGQDIASVHECSIAHLNMEQNDEGIYASISLPSLVIGTIGGGTALPHQRDCLSMLDCAGSGKSRKLAEIIASFALALDLSTASALAGGQFAVSHERLGRNKPVNYLKPDELTPDFFNTLINHGEAKTSKVIAAEPIVDLTLGSSIITELSRKGQEKFIGHYPFELTLQNDDGETSLEVMIKSKPTDAEVINMVGKLAMLGSSDLLEAYHRQNGLIDFKNCHTRELALSTLDVPALSAVMPDVHGTYQDASREIFITATELLRDMELMDTADDVSDWTSDHINQALDEIAPVHAHWLGKESELKDLGLFDNAPSAKQMVGASDLWREMAQLAHDEFPGWVSADHLARYQRMIETLPDWWGGMEALPVTLIHNDFNPRNLAFKVRDGQRKLCVYDWELATISLPQHDVAELLSFTLSQDCTLAAVQEYAERHRRSLETLSGQVLDAEDWWRGFHWSLQDYAVNRVLAYTMAHNAKHYSFMERMFATAMHLLDLVGETTQ